MKRKTFLIVFTALIVVLAFAAWKVFGPSVSSPEEKNLYVKTGSAFSDLKDQLVSKKIISSGRWFDWVASVMKFSVAKAGKYEIKDGMSLFQLIRMLKNGKQTPVKLTITKIRLKEDLARKLAQQFEFDSLTAMQFFTSNDSLLQFGLDTSTMMAAVMPNTYSFYWNSNPKKVYQKLFDNWQQYWTAERKTKAAAISLSPIQVATLASIVDEEVNIRSEKEKIASVYLNRLNKKMNMQACPTVKYALKDFGLKRIYEKHLAVQSPYNTYIHEGLPPGPICTPQPETIDIILNAPQTEYLYFVANSDFSGTHIYSATYDEHLKYAKLFAAAQDKQEQIRKTRQ
jgi:UPF0755 protein